MKNRCKCAFAGNPATRLFLGLCPVAAAATCGVNALAIGVVMLIVLLGSGLLIAALKKILSEGARIAVSALIICMMTGVVELLMKLWLPVLAAELGIFIPLCAVGAMLVLLPEGCECPACRGAKCGFASLCMLVLLGAICELIGSGSVFGAALWKNPNAQVLIARFPAGAYIVLGILMGIFTAIFKRGKEDAE